MDVHKVAHDADGALAIVMVDGRCFVHGSILDKQFSDGNAEKQRLLECLQEAISIAHGSGADYTWQTLDRLRELQAIADGRAPVIVDDATNALGQ